VKAGGTVVCTDPEAFTWNINGEVLSNQWEELSGVHKSTLRTTTPETTIQIKPAALLKKAALSVKYDVTGWSINPTDNAVTILATFADGAPAITSHKYGKGRVITFAIDAFASPYLNSANVALFKNIQTAIGARENLAIWRFKLPPFKTVSDEDPPSKFVCLTNNNMVFERSQSKAKDNQATGGTYSYENAPTGIADVNSLKANIPFAEGHLTNRKIALDQRDTKGAKGPADLEKWIVCWNDAAPASITFDLKKTYGLHQFNLFYSGQLPALQMECSTDGKIWIAQSSLAAKPATADVLNAEMQLSGKYRYVRLKIGARQAGQEFRLSEVEIWGVIRRVRKKD
jgi:hypothetical protein